MKYELKHNPEATIMIYCGLGFNYKGEPRDNDRLDVCFEFVA